jgi:hypothetical protein
VVCWVKLSSATKKFLKEGINRFPSSLLKEGLTKNQKNSS